MKKIFFGIVALVAMVATSCQQSFDELNVVGDGDATVSFNVGTPAAIQSRAYSDGKTAQHLQWAVYSITGTDAAKTLTLRPNLKGEKNFTLSTTVEFQLTTGNKYAVIFWADADESPYTVNFDTNGATMTVDYTGAKSSDENRDAFYKYYEFSVSGSQTETIELKRPFAQLNIGTNDYTASTDAGYTVSHVKVEVPAYNTLNLVSGEATGDVTTAVLFDYAAIPTTETFPVTGYEYMAMNYVLMNSVKETFDVTFTYATAYDSATGVATNEKVRLVGSVPLERNHRTNLYGQLLTGNVNFNVVIKPEYDDPAHEASELELAAAFGGTVTLTEDVVLESALNVQSNMTINLNGHNLTISAAYDANNYEASSAIVNNSKLTLTGNGTIKATNNYTVRNNGTMVIDGVTIENGIMNFGDLTIEGGNISNSRTGKHAIYGNNAKLTINGGEFHNENPGNATIFAYEGEVVINDGEFSIADGTSTLGWTSCLIDAQGSAKYTLNGGAFNGEIRDYNNNTKVYGGTYTHNSVVNFVADGYKAAQISGVYHIFPESIADAVTAAGVTSITETFNDVKTALATNNGETTLYIWNGVAYIAKYEEVTMVASADGTTTSRGVVENNPENDPNWPLKSAVVAEGIEVVGNRTFRRCYNLESVELPSTLTEISSGAFQSCNKLANVTIPAGVTTIGEGAFLECASLTSITIPAGVTRLENDVLRATGLTSIECHEGVTYFGAQAFRDCKQLQTVIIKAPSFTVEANAFGVMSGTLPNTTIYVANEEMKSYLESTLTYKTQFTVVVM